jgi:hypothetical protein
MPGVLELIAYEYYINEQEDDVEKGIVDAWGEEIPEPQNDAILGETFIKPKMVYNYEYTGEKLKDAQWSFDSRLPLETHINGTKITIKWTTTYAG